MVKTRIGRPPRSGKVATERLELRLTATEMRRWKAAAKRADNSVLSEYVREAVEQRMERER